MKKVKDPELLTKYCEILSDDEVELQNCPFVYEYDGSPQSSPSVAVSPSSEATGILMLSVTSTDSDEQSSPHENEEFETPPEQNNSSQPYFSGSDELKPSTSLGVDTDAVNQGNVEAVDLGNDSDENQNHLGFLNRREVDVCEIGDFEEQLRKRYRISEEDLDVKKEAIVIEIDQTQTQGVDTEVVECEQNFEVYERGIERNADTSTVKMSERGEEEEEVDDNEKLNGVGTGEMDMTGIKDGVGDGDGDGESEGERGVVSMNLDENEKLNGVCVKEMHSNGITRSVGVDGDGEGGVVSMNLDENEKLKDGVCVEEMHSHGITRSGGADGDGERGVASMNLDENEKLKDGVCVKEMHSKGIKRSVDVDGVGVGVGGSVKGRRELPISMRGRDKNVGLLEEVGRRATKSGMFKDLVEAFSMVVGDVSGDDKNAADFLETAKRRGLSFPRPRWWPPEGFDD